MKVSKGTIVRTVMLVIVVLNMILQHFGLDVIDVSEVQVLAFIELLIEIAVIVVAFWKNNSYSKNAILADAYLKDLREAE